MAVLNKRAVVSAIEMYGVSAIRLPMVLGESFNQIIKSLFANGEQGFAYDPNDLTTMFQDAAGTIPVTDAGQPVGLVKDKSGRNNHAYQTVSASRPILRQTPILGSELIVNGDFSNGITGVAAKNNVTLSVTDGVLKVTNNDIFYGFAEMSFNTEIGKKYLLKADVIASSGAGASFHVASTTNSSNILSNVDTTTMGKGVVITATTTSTYISLKVPTNVVGSWRTFDNVSAKELQGYYTDRNYLEFDGADDFLQTNNIDFTSTDKVSVFAGVRKLSDVNSAIVIEHGVAGVNNKAFTMSAPDGNNLSNYSASLRNTSRATVFLNNKASPRSSVLSVELNYTGATITDQVKMIENATPAPPSTGGSLLTATNFNDAPIYIGRRGGTSLPFNGHIYGLIGIGKLASENETAAIEKELAKRLGVTLNV